MKTIVLRSLVLFVVSFLGLRVPSANAHDLGFLDPIGVGAVGGFGNGWGFAEASTVQGDFLRWLGQARLNEAQAIWVEAMAAEQYERAFAINRVVQALQTDLVRIDSYINEMNNGAKSVYNVTRRLNGLLMGHINSGTISSLRYLFTLVPQDIIQGLLSDEAIIGEVSAKDFVLSSTWRTVYNPETKTLEKEIVHLYDFPGGNVFAYIDWLRSAKVDMKAIPGSNGHNHILKMRGIVRQAAEKWIDDIQSRRLAYEDRKLNIWGPVYTGGFNLPARNIEGL